MGDARELGEVVRRAIAGVPRAGKTTLARTLGAVRSTDDVMGLGWSGASDEVAAWLDEPGPLVVEGMAVPRALRKWLRAHPEGRPVDEVVWLGTPREELTPGQRRMGAGADTVMREIESELRRRGVIVRRR